MSAKLTKAEVDEIEKFCENSPTWTLERVPRLIAHVRAQDEFLKEIAAVFQDYEPLEESQHWSDCPLADGYWDEEDGKSALTEEIVLSKCECSMKPMLQVIRAARMEE